MKTFYFPCSGIGPEFEGDSVFVGDVGIQRRLWQTTPFDLATLASRHRLHVPWHLMAAFLEDAHCEIVVSGASNYEASRELARLFQTMIYLEGITPFIIPFGATHSVNSYSGINSRDSSSPKDKLPEGLREGLTSDTGTVEVWPHEPALFCLHILGKNSITAEVAESAASTVSLWAELEENHPQLSAVRSALQTAPMVPDIGASLLHVWQGIESLFPDVRSEVSFRISLLVAQLCGTVSPPDETYQRARTSYGHRSNAAHGNLKRIGRDEWHEAWKLLVLCMRAVRDRRMVPTEAELISGLLRRSQSGLTPSD